MSNVLVLGATSSMARAIAHELARQGHDLILAGRDEDELGRIAGDLSLRRGVQVKVRRFDALAFDEHPAFFQSCVEEAGGLGGVVLCYGYMGAQERSQRDFAAARAVIDTTFTSCVSILNLAANEFEAKRGGFICAISSVAGDRGRATNYIYGSAKGGLSVYLQGLRQRLAKAGVPVLTVKPGFVDTSMTFGLPGLFLVASPQAVAADIVAAIGKRKDVIYVPWFWWGIMTIIKNVPERIFKKLNL